MCREPKHLKSSIRKPSVILDCKAMENIPEFGRGTVKKRHKKFLDRELAAYKQLSALTEYQGNIPVRKGPIEMEMIKYRPHRPGPNRCRSSFIKLVRLLQRIHQAGVIHCDVKPEHVFETRSGKLILIDFDQAEVVGADIKGGGYTLDYVSADRLLHHTRHFLDDLEAACWTALSWAGQETPLPIVSEPSTEDKLAANLERMVTFSGQPNLDWLQQRLLFVWSRRRPAKSNSVPLGETVYDSLTDRNYVFTQVNAVQELFDEIKTRTERTRVPKDKFNANAGPTFEEFVVNQPDKLFVIAPNFTLDRYCNWEFKDNGKALTEMDAIIPAPLDRNLVVEQPRELMPNPRNMLTECYSYINGGKFLVLEIWGDQREKDNIQKKFDILLSGYRPYHVLLFFKHFIMFGGPLKIGHEIVLGKDGGSAKDLLTLLRRTYCWALSVLCAVGRLHYVYSANLSLFTIAKQTAQTTVKLEIELEEERQARQKERQARQKAEQKVAQLEKELSRLKQQGRHPAHRSRSRLRHSRRRSRLGDAKAASSHSSHGASRRGQRSPTPHQRFRRASPSISSSRSPARGRSRQECRKRSSWRRSCHGSSPERSRSVRNRNSSGSHRK